MFLILGLGNIGEKYKLTRHNIGFMIIDNIINKLITSNINKSYFNAQIFKTIDTIFAKPKTYMNNSGYCAKAIKDYYKIDISNIIVIHDDIDLSFGEVRFKVGGSNGGHNGLKSIDSNIGKDYARIRVGVGRPSYRVDVINYVLSDFSKVELNKLENIIKHICSCIELLKSEDINIVKSKYTLKI
jgi:peptidyl-tRNA hydrolase, PTH1 family